MSRILYMHGVGDIFGPGYYKVDSSGNTVDCDSLTNIFNPICWTPGINAGSPGYTTPEQAQANAAASGNPPAPQPDNTALYVAVGLGALGFFLVFMGAKR